MELVKRYQGNYKLPVIDDKIAIPALILEKILNNERKFRMLSHFPFGENALACMTEGVFKDILERGAFEDEFCVDEGIYKMAAIERLHRDNKIILPEKIAKDRLHLIPENEYFLLYPPVSFRHFERMANIDARQYEEYFILPMTSND